jgi:hypothetical protein
MNRHLVRIARWPAEFVAAGREALSFGILGAFAIFFLGWLWGVGAIPEPLVGRYVQFGSSEMADLRTLRSLQLAPELEAEVENVWTRCAVGVASIESPVCPDRNCTKQFSQALRESEERYRLLYAVVSCDLSQTSFPSECRDIVVECGANEVVELHGYAQMPQFQNAGQSRDDLGVIHETINRRLGEIDEIHSFIFAQRRLRGDVALWAFFATLVGIALWAATGWNRRIGTRSFTFERQMVKTRWFHFSMFALTVPYALLIDHFLLPNGILGDGRELFGLYMVMVFLSVSMLNLLLHVPVSQMYRGRITLGFGFWSPTYVVTAVSGVAVFAASFYSISLAADPSGFDLIFEDARDLVWFLTSTLLVACLLLPPRLWTRPFQLSLLLGLYTSFVVQSTILLLPQGFEDRQYGPAESTWLRLIAVSMITLLGTSGYSPFARWWWRLRMTLDEGT